MINHARSLLMNLDGSKNLLHEPGAEYVPTTFRAVTLPGSLTAIRRVLFGTNPDRPMRNYRCRQLMTLLHSCELKEFVTELDPRITYDFADDPYFDNELFQPRIIDIEALSGSFTQMTSTGLGPAPDHTGQMSMMWSIQVPIDGAAVVALFHPYRQSLESFTYVSGLSSPIPLLGSDITVRIHSKVFPFGQGPRWRVESLARPTFDLGQLLASLEQTSAENLAALFAVGTERGSQEPMVTFRRCWEEHYDLPHRLGGALLALIYETEERRIP